MPEHEPHPITPEEEARIREADRSGREQAEKLLGKKAAREFFEVMDKKRAENDPNK